MFLFQAQKLFGKMKTITSKFLRSVTTKLHTVHDVVHMVEKQKCENRPRITRPASSAMKDCQMKILGSAPAAIQKMEIQPRHLLVVTTSSTAMAERASQRNDRRFCIS